MPLKYHPGLEALRRLQSKTPLNTLRIVSPPIRHSNYLPRPKAEKYNQNVEIKSCIKRCRQYIVISCPYLVMMSIGPIHDDEAPNDAGQVTSRHVTPERRHRREEDRAIPEMEVCAGKAFV